uniref:Uncharacterized protein n=1 Tax=Gopherus agassizii TaxID=38772 RepID=A0A452GGD3_9SAUR
MFTRQSCLPEPFGKHTGADSSAALFCPGGGTIKPLWLRDMYLPLDSIRKKSMAQKLYDRESSDEEEIFNRADVR